MEKETFERVRTPSEIMAKSYEEHKEELDKAWKSFKEYVETSIENAIRRGEHHCWIGVTELEDNLAGTKTSGEFLSIYSRVLQYESGQSFIPEMIERLKKTSNYKVSLERCDDSEARIIKFDYFIKRKFRLNKWPFIYYEEVPRIGVLNSSEYTMYDLISMRCGERDWCYGDDTHNKFVEQLSHEGIKLRNHGIKISWEKEDEKAE